MACSLPGSSVRGILQARILECVAMPFSRGTFQPRDQTHVSYISCTGRQALYHYHHLGSPLVIIKKKIYIQQMLERVWRKGNSSTVLMGMYIV